MDSTYPHHILMGMLTDVLIIFVIKIFKIKTCDYVDNK